MQQSPAKHWGTFLKSPTVGQVAARKTNALWKTRS